MAFKKIFIKILLAIKSFVKRNKKKSIAIIIILIFGIFFFNQNSQNIEIGKLESGNLEEIVSVSGTVYPNEESALAFEKSGKIQSINVKVGDKVRTGQVLASLSSGSEFASVLNAKAGLEVAEANLADAQNGASAQELAVKEQAVSSARNNLMVANISAGDGLRNVNTSITDIIGYKTGNIFSYNGSYRLKFNSCDQVSQANIERERGDFDLSLASLDALARDFSILGLTDEKEINKKIDSAGDEAYKVSVALLNLLNNIDKLLNIPCSASDTSLDTYRSSISQARTSVNSTISSLTSLKSQLIGFRNTLASAEATLEEVKAGSTPEKLKSLQASVNSARANLISAQSINAKNIIVAPFDGTVTHVNLNLGEVSSPNSPAIKVISYNNLQLKIKLSEIDLVKVKPGNKARVYLDTYGDSVVFDGVVSQVDPAPTSEGNSSNYFAKIDFNTQDDRVRPGMNGTSDIVTSSKENTDYILAGYLKVDGQEIQVKVIKDITKISKTTTNDNDKNIEWRNIKTGIRDIDGKVEILSGLTKEDRLFPIGKEVLGSESN